MENWNWAVWLVVVRLISEPMFAVYLHGNPRGKWDANQTIATSLILFILLYFGGFFQ